jgi:hypothetical protein
MKIANIREFRSKTTAYLREKESVLITRHGKITGLLYPIEDTDVLPDDLQKSVTGVLAAAQACDIMPLVLNELKKVVKIRKVKIEDIKKLQKEWKFRGSLSDEVIAERNKR